MRFEFDVDGRVRTVTIEAEGTGLGVTLDGTPVDLEIAPVGGGRYSFRVPGSGRQHEVTVTASAARGTFDVAVDGHRIAVTRRVDGACGRRGAGAILDGPQRIVAPMPGKVVKVLVKPGEEVAPRQGVIVVEAMKMENELRAARAGVVREVLVVEGTSVEAGAALVVIG